MTKKKIIKGISLNSSVTNFIYLITCRNNKKQRKSRKIVENKKKNPSSPIKKVGVKKVNAGEEKNKVLLPISMELKDIYDMIDGQAVLKDSAKAIPEEKDKKVKRKSSSTPQRYLFCYVNIRLLTFEYYSSDNILISDQ